MSDDAGGRGWRPPPMPLPVIPGYADLVEIGRGGYAIVYRARQEAMGRTVAVKVLARMDVSGDQLRRFRRECEAMGMLSWHPHIVVVHDAGSTETGAPYLAMEHLPAGSLGDELRANGPLPWAHVLAIGVQLADALEAAHRAGLLHRDVKPENVLLDRFGESKLSDFGIAAVHDSTTATQGITGTIAHTAPEILAGGRATVASDLYSLGSTLHTLLTGRAAFVRPNDESFVPVAFRITHEAVPDLRADGVPDELATAVEHAMAKTPGERPPTAAAYARDLQEVQRRLGTPVTRTRATDLGRADDRPAAAAPPPAPAAAVPPAGWGEPRHAAAAAAAASAAAAAASGPPPGRPAPMVVPVSPTGAPAAPRYAHTGGAVPPGPPPRRRSRRTAAVVAGVLIAVATGLALGLVLVNDDGGGGGGDAAAGATTRPSATGTSTPDTTPTTVATTAAPTTTIDRTVDAVVHQVAQPSPGASQLAAVAVGADGSLWVTDYAQGRVVHLSPDGTEQERFDRSQVGANPGSVVVTSSGIWVVSQNQGVVHIQSGQAHAVTPVAQPVGIAEAPGGDVWVAAHGGASIVRIDGNNDQLVETRPVGDGPFGVDADGIQVFTTHDAAGQAHISLGAELLSGETVGVNPWAVLATDDAVWVTNSGSTQDPAADGARGSVMRFNRATFGTGTGEQPVVVDVGRNPRSLWRQADGTIWVTVWGDDRVVRLDGRTGQELAAYCTGASSHPNGISGRLNTVYVVTEGDGLLHSIDTGARPSRNCPKGA